MTSCSFVRIVRVHYKILKECEDTKMRNRQIKFTDDVWAKAKAKAKSQSISLSSIIRRMVEMWLNGEITVKF